MEQRMHNELLAAQQEELKREINDLFENEEPIKPKKVTKKKKTKEVIDKITGENKPVPAEEPKIKQIDFWQIDMKIRSKTHVWKKTGIIIAHKSAMAQQVKEDTKKEMLDSFEKRYPQMSIISLDILRCVKIKSDYFINFYQQEVESK